MTPIVTERLILRAWRPEDRPAFATINADPAVMRFLPGVLDRAASDALIDRFETGLTTERFGHLAVEEIATGRMLGFVGLRNIPDTIRFAPAVDIGWRLASDVWRKGYASEAARAMLAHGFGELLLPEIVSFTVPSNVASRRVMEKIGLRRSASLDFDYPGMGDENPLRRHVVYRIASTDWRAFHA